jgi:hypothetical protein
MFTDNSKIFAHLFHRPTPPAHSEFVHLMDLCTLRIISCRYPYLLDALDYYFFLATTQTAFIVQRYL